MNCPTTRCAGNPSSGLSQLVLCGRAALVQGSVSRHDRLLEREYSSLRSVMVLVGSVTGIPSTKGDLICIDRRYMNQQLRRFPVSRRRVTRHRGRSRDALTTEGFPASTAAEQWLTIAGTLSPRAMLRARGPACRSLRSRGLMTSVRKIAARRTEAQVPFCRRRRISPSEKPLRTSRDGRRIGIIGGFRSGFHARFTAAAEFPRSLEIRQPFGLECGRESAHGTNRRGECGAVGLSPVQVPGAGRRVPALHTQGPSGWDRAGCQVAGRRCSLDICGAVVFLDVQVQVPGAGRRRSLLHTRGHRLDVQCPGARCRSVRSPLHTRGRGLDVEVPGAGRCAPPPPTPPPAASRSHVLQHGGWLTKRV